MTKEQMEEETLQAVSEILIGELMQQGSEGYILLGLKRPTPQTADIWMRAKCGAVQAANMIAYALSLMPPDGVQKAIRVLMTHPLIMEKLAAAEAAAQPGTQVQEEPPAPESPAKKEWLN